MEKVPACIEFSGECVIIDREYIGDFTFRSWRLDAAKNGLSYTRHASEDCRETVCLIRPEQKPGNERASWDCKAYLMVLSVMQHTGKVP